MYDFIKNKKLVMFGSGSAAENILSILPSNISYIVDNDKNKWGKLLSGYLIKEPKALLTERQDQLIIIVASMYYKEIALQLNELGFQEYRHFLNIADIFSIRSARSATIELENSNFTLLKSFSDGRVLIDREGKKVLRAFYKSVASDYLEVYNHCTHLELIDNGLIDIHLTRQKIPPFEIIFEQKYINPMTKPEDWSPLMKFDATIATLSLLIKLASKGLTLHDPILPNIVYNDSKFEWLDFGSLMKIDRMTTGTPPIFWSLKHFLDFIVPEMTFFQNIATYRLKDKSYNEEFYLSNPTYGYMNENQRLRYKQVMTDVMELFNLKDYAGSFRELKKYIEKDFTIKVNEDLLYYYSNMIDQEVKKDIDVIISCIQQLTNSTVLILDIGKKLAKKSIFIFNQMPNFEATLLTDDEDYNDVLYTMVKNKQINCIPLVTKVFNHSSIHVKNEQRDLFDRLKTEVVVAISTIHELVFCRQYSFEEIFGTLSQLTKSVLIFDFYEPNHKLIQVWLNNDLNRETYLDEYCWYTFEKMMEAHNKYFQLITVESLKGEEIKIIKSRKK